MNEDILYWVFHQAQLDKALAEHREIARQRADEQRAKEEAEAIENFLTKGAGRALQGGRAK